MKVLGVDPGTRIVGYSILEDIQGQIVVHTYGAIVGNLKLSLSERLLQIYNQLDKIAREYQPEAVAVEKVFAGKNYQSAIKIGEGRGIALLVAGSYHLPVFEYDATRIKKAVAGVGSAHKTQIQAMVQAILQLSEVPKPNDAADALAISMCHLQNYRWQSAIQEQT